MPVKIETVGDVTVIDARELVMQKGREAHARLAEHLLIKEPEASSSPDDPSGDVKTATSSAEGLKPVTHGDLTAYAKRDCRTCNGTGRLITVRGVDRDASRTLDGKPVEATRNVKACGCALRRFLKVNRHRITIDTKTGALQWLPERVAESLAELGWYRPGMTPAEAAAARRAALSPSATVNPDSSVVPEPPK